MASSPDRPPTAAQALDQLDRSSLHELSMEALLQSLADRTKSVMPGDPEVSVTLLVDGTGVTVADTGHLAVDLDRSQYERDGGPCLHAARTGVVTEIVDTRADLRWPDHVRRAVECGNLSSLSVPLVLPHEQQLVGSLNIYAREPRAFDATSRSVATGFAPYAAVAAGSVQAYRSARDRADDLQVALESRAVIEQAKGILMERHRSTADEAFQLLVTASMTTNTKLRTIAAHLVETGELRTR